MSIAVAERIPEVRELVRTARRAGREVGFVPTMGALHAGHARLIEVARAAGGYVVVSIFVNPTQFGPNEDFAKYPRTLSADCELAERAGADLIFAPTVSEMYPAESRTSVDVAQLTEGLCGASRPGHFRGVCTVVAKLFGIVQPDVAYFGQKDAQQVAVISRMTQDLNFPIQIEVVPTVREPDGLAMSSRNRYLNESERAVAPRIYEQLRRIEQKIGTGCRDVAELKQELTAGLAAIPGARVDYAEMVDADSLGPVGPASARALLAVAVHLGTTRLIDNIVTTWR